jgi:hypothetical protein
VVKLYITKKGGIFNVNNKRFGKTNGQVLALCRNQNRVVIKNKLKKKKKEKIEKNE